MRYGAVRLQRRSRHIYSLVAHSKPSKALSLCMRVTSRKLQRSWSVSLDLLKYAEAFYFIATLSLRFSKVDKSDLKALLEANKSDKGHYHFSQRLAFVMNEASIDDLLKQLSDSTLTLRDFVDDNEDLHQIQRSNKEPQQIKQHRVANSLHKVRRHANALYRAIACGWSRQCHERHGAMLCLEHRCHRKHHIPQGPTGYDETAVRFTILYSWQEQATQESVAWHETSILTIDEDYSSVLSHAT